MKGGIDGVLFRKRAVKSVMGGGDRHPETSWNKSKP